MDLPASSSASAASALQKLSRRWEDRACVRHHHVTDDVPFDLTAPDYLDELLPFADHPRYLSAPESVKQPLRSVGFLAYMQKTLDIESRIVIPACLRMSTGRIVGADDPPNRRSAAEAMTDESYHVLLCEHARQVVARARGLESLALPPCRAIRSLEHRLSDTAQESGRDLVIVAAAIVTEVYISSYLRRLASAERVQPFCVETTRTHLHDELTHGHIFKAFARSVWSGLLEAERARFVQVFVDVQRWFADCELVTWRHAFERLRLPWGEAVVDDLRGATQRHEVDDRELRKLLAELDIDLDDVRPAS